MKKGGDPGAPSEGPAIHSPAEAPEQVGILIADDHELLRRGLCAVLAERTDWKVVGEAANGREAVRLAASLKPAAVVLDVTMPELNGLEATRQILAAAPQTRVLILSVHESEQIVREVLEAGAQGYLLKSDAGRELVKAIDALLGNKPYFTSTVARMVLKGFLSAPRAESSSDETGRLSPRERETVQLLAEGRSNKEVAAMLGISVKTAETHRNNVMQKMGFHSITELVRYAVRNKLIEP
ncbi:MAG TPA: response regulator transcription factor [Opitutaceae bacterium]|nr:response regulator transcription factor [Opitutaceae bacterium]